MTRRYNHVAMEFLYGIFHYLALTIYDICFRGEVAGLENIPKRGAFIVACNHASHLDPPIIGSLVPRQMAFFASAPFPSIEMAGPTSPPFGACCRR